MNPRQCYRITRKGEIKEFLQVGENERYYHLKTLDTNKRITVLKKAVCFNKIEALVFAKNYLFKAKVNIDKEIVYINRRIDEIEKELKNESD